MPKIFLKLFLLLILIAPTAHAQTGAWVKTNNSKTRLISAVKTIGNDKTVKAAIELELNQGWHTYWKHAGDAGLAPRFDWSKSENVENIEILWPLPARKTEQDLFTVFSYGAKTLFPINVALKDTSQPAKINMVVKFMVCKDICIPEQSTISLTIPAGEGKPSIHEKDISFARLKVPQAKPNDHVKIIGASADKQTLNIKTKITRGYKNIPLVIAYTDDMAFTAKPEIKIDKNDPSLAIISISAPENLELTGKPLQIILSDGRIAIEKKIEL